MAEETEKELTNLQKQDLLKDEIQKGLNDEQPSDSKRISVISEPRSSSKDLKSKKKSIKKFYEKSPNSKIIPRRCLDKQDWINLLATPSRKYSSCEDKNFGVNNTVVYHHKLSQPPRRRLIATLQERAAVLPASLVDKLIHILTNDDDLSLEQIEKLFQNISKKKKKKVVKKIKCQNVIKPVQSDESSKMSKDAILCQYSIAESFVKSILQQKNATLREDLTDLVDVVQKKLNSTINDTKINLDKDEILYHQTLFLSKLIANWIAGILEECAAQNEEELKKECNEKRKKLEADLDYDDDDNDVVDEDDYNDGDNDDDNNNEDDDNDSDDENDNNDKTEEITNSMIDNEKSTDNAIHEEENEINAHNYDSDNKIDKNNTNEKKLDENNEHDEETEEE